MSIPQPLGEIKPTPGSPLPITLNFPEYAHELCNAIYLQVLESNLGYVYIGNQALDRNDPTTIILILPPPTLNSTPDVNWYIPGAPNPFMLKEYKVDVDEAGDGIRGNFIQL